MSRCPSWKGKFPVHDLSLFEDRRGGTHCPLMKHTYPPVDNKIINETNDIQAANGWNGPFHGNSVL